MGDSQNDFFGSLLGSNLKFGVRSLSVCALSLHLQVELLPSTTSIGGFLFAVRIHIFLLLKLLHVLLYIHMVKNFVGGFAGALVDSSAFRNTLQ